MRDFETVYGAYYPRVYRFVLSLCRDAARAEDITQGAFVKAFRHYSDFRGDCDVGSWLCRIAKNELLDDLRKHPPQDAAPDDSLPDGQQAPEEWVIDASDALTVQRILHKLAEPYKEVFMLRVYGEMEYDRIGALFGKSDNWARVTFFRAKQKVMDDMRRNEHE